MKMLMITLMSIISSSVVCAQSYQEVTMNVGETRTFYLPSSVTSKDLKSVTFYSNGISYVQVTSYTRYSVTVKAIKAFSSPLIVRCDYYYFVKRGSFTYEMSGAYDYRITVVGGDDEDSGNEPTSIRFSSTAVGLSVGESRQLTPTVLPANAKYTLTWSINDTSVATISQSGLLVGKSAGAADLKVKAQNGVYAMLRVVVSEPTPTSVSVSPSSLSVTEGESKYLSATVYPSTASQSVTWSSSNTSVATISSTGKVTAIKAGTATMTARTSNGKTGTCSVTVKSNKPNQITIPATMKLIVGDKQKITPTFTPLNASANLTWSSSDKNVATVSSDGTVTALASGTSTIQVVTDNYLSATCQLTVTNDPKQIELVKEAGEVFIGDNVKLTAKLTPSQATTTFTWTSDNEEVATVISSSTDSKEVYVKAHKGGKANITVKTANGLTASCEITVKEYSTSEEAGRKIRKAKERIAEDVLFIRDKHLK